MPLQVRLRGGLRGSPSTSARVSWRGRCWLATRCLHKIHAPEMAWLHDNQTPPGVRRSQHCSSTAGLLRTLHVQGLPPSMTAAQVSEMMSQHGPVQYAEVGR